MLSRAIKTVSRAICRDADVEPETVSPDETFQVLISLDDDWELFSTHRTFGEAVRQAQDLCLLITSLPLQVRTARGDVLLMMLNNRIIEPFEMCRSAGRRRVSSTPEAVLTDGPQRSAG